jgi:acetyltransferase-like isoleucine patch superfamily enzyme
MNSCQLEHDWFSRPLPTNVHVGEGSFLYSSFAFVHCKSQVPYGVRIGRHTGIYNGTFFDLGPHGQVEIGDYCSLVGVIFATDSKVSIGDFSFIAHEVVIADNEWAIAGFHSPPRSPAIALMGPASGRVNIGTNVWIGAQAAVVGSVTVGDGAIIGAAAVVRQDVPPYTVWAGNPARKVRDLPRG